MGGHRGLVYQNSQQFEGRTVEGEIYILILDRAEYDVAPVVGF